MEAEVTGVEMSQGACDGGRDVTDVTGVEMLDL